MKKQKALFLAQAAIIAALYAVLTILQNTLLPGTASMVVQFRVSEVLTVLAIFTPAAIPGLTIGCLAANLSSLPSLGPVDLVFGTLASFAAAVLMYALRNVRFFRLPVLSALMPAIVNGIIVGFEIDFFFINDFRFSLPDFLFQGGCVALGELGVLFLLGLPLAVLIEKRGLNNNWFKQK